MKIDFSTSKVKKPHAVFIPFPSQGHINPMLKLAKLLHSKGFHITFVNTEYNHKRLLKSRGFEAMASVPNFDFDAIPDGLPLSDFIDATQDISSLLDSITKTCLEPFLELLHKLNAKSLVVEGPPVTCIVADVSMVFSVRAAEVLGVPIALFWTVSACAVLGFMRLPHLIQTGLIHPKDPTNEQYSETLIDWIPSKKIPVKAMPIETNPKDISLNFLNEMIEQTQKASILGIIFNTFQSLEAQVLGFLSTKLPNILAIGPIGLLSDHELTLGLSLWKEDPQCLQWLDSRHPSSVVYVNFGSIAVLTKEHLVELAWGLANSGMSFLWIIRPDLVHGGAAAVLPPQFFSQTEGQGMLASWCPQEKVLKHPAVGGFLTHNGWNSTLESLSHGVPMIGMPFRADQHTNCWHCCWEWEIGMEINKDVKRDEVEKLVRMLMEGEKGKEMKKKAMKWKLEAEEAIKPGGSSFQDMEKLIHQLSN